MTPLPLETQIAKLETTLLRLLDRDAITNTAYLTITDHLNLIYVELRHERDQTKRAQPTE